MPTSAERIQVLFEIAISIGKSLDLKKMVKESLPKIVRLLNCAAGGIHQFVETPDNKYSLESVQTIPLNVSSVVMYQQALKQLYKITKIDDVHQFYQKGTIQNYSQSTGGYYCLPLPDFGVLVLVTGENPMDPITLKSMTPIIEHLAKACLACLQNEKIELSREKLFLANAELVLQGEKLKEREKELSLVTQSTLDTIFIVSKTGRILYISPSVEKLIGESPEEIIGKPMIVCFPQDEVQRFQKTTEEIFQENQIDHFESIIKHKNGNRIPIEMNGRLIRKDGELVVQGTFRNITERKKYERVKENYRKDLEKSIKERTNEIEEQLEIAETAREAMLNILDDVMSARAELKESETLYRDLYNNAPILYHTIDLEGMILECNDELLRRLQYKKEEYVGHHLSEYLYAKNEEESIKAVDYIIQNMGKTRMREKFKCRDDSIFYADIYSSIETDEKGNPISIRSAIVDCSNQIERERLESLVLLRTKIEAKTIELTTPEEISEIDVTVVLQKLAKFYKENLKASAVLFFKKLEGKNGFANLVLEADPEQIKKMITLLPTFDRRSPITIDENSKMVEVLKKNSPLISDDFTVFGESTKILKHVEIYPDHQFVLIPLTLLGTPWGLLGIVTEKEIDLYAIVETIKETINQGMLKIEVINERIKTRKELERLAEFPTQNPRPVIEVDLNGSVTYYNDAVSKILGTLNLPDFNPEIILPKQFKTLVKEALETGGDIENIEVKIGKQVLLWIGRPIQSFNLVHFHASDITELKTVEEKLREAKELAEASDRLKTIFIGMISHEVRTPLNTILGYSDVLQNELKNKLTDQENKIFQIINKSGDRLKKMVEDILDVSRVEADRIITQLVLTNADQLILDGINEIGMQAQEKNLYIKTDLNGSSCGIKVDLTFHHRFIYPTPLLRKLQKPGMFGMISPEADVGKIPHIFVFHNEILKSLVVNKNTLLLKVGATFALTSQKIDNRISIDLPLVYPRMGEYFNGYKVNVGLDIQHQYSNKISFLVDGDIFIIPEEELFYESKLIGEYKLNESWKILAGTKLTHGQYPFGKQTRLLPLFDITYQW